MPVLNYHKDDPALPDMSALQKCDGCGAENVGNQMYFFRYYGNNQIGVICRPCFLQVYGGPAPITPPMANHEPAPDQPESPEWLPGINFAKHHGYSVQAFSASRNSATYTKHVDGEVIFLICKNSEKGVLAKIVKYVGLITVTTEEFSLPGNFHIFEHQIIGIKKQHA